MGQDSAITTPGNTMVEMMVVPWGWAQRNINTVTLGTETMVIPWTAWDSIGGGLLSSRFHNAGQQIPTTSGHF